MGRGAGGPPWIAGAGKALIVLALVIFALQCAAVWQFTVDDSYISFRYARNLANGHGPTWNAGEPPVEGYTSFLWVLGTAIPHIIGLDAVLSAKIVGMAATLGTMGCVYFMVLEGTRRASRSFCVLGAGHAVLLLAAFMPSATHAVSGMETALYALLIAALGLAVLRAIETGGRATWVAAVLALLLGLTRPEGNLVAIVALALGMACAPRGRRRQIAKAALLCYVLPGIIYFVARACYYGVPLPLPFYIKIASQPVSGLGMVIRFSRYLAMAVGPLIVAGLFALRRGVFPGVLAAAALVGFFVVPAHIMGYGWRFLYPATPIALAVAGSGTATAAAWVLRRSPGLRCGSLGGLVIGLVVAGSVAMMARETVGLITANRRTAAAMHRAHVPLGKLLEHISRPQDHLLAIGDAGAVPYYSRWRTIDTFGLNDRVIARSGKHDSAYVLDQQPDLLVLISSSQDEFRARLEWEVGLLGDARARGMKRVGVVTYLPGSYYLWLLAKPGSDVADLIAGSPWHGP